ncbi:hypothetical protein [Leucobacter chromiireducens]|uniref:hypothetical protein n=1 Tax=Leucobacter chromiireducens TaxID=283877 RepID=UPI0013DDB739|nr:hypothetical protein [Leucobacter chromiireducens]
MDTTTPKRRKRLSIGIVAGVAALALAGAGTAYGINAANVRAYDDAAARHAELLDSAALAEAQLPLAQHGYVAAWRLATAEEGSAASQAALVAAADDGVVSADAKAGLAPLAKAIEALAADDAAAPTVDEIEASEAVQELLDDEETDAAAFAPAEATSRFPFSDEGASTGSEARAEVDAAIGAAQERLDGLTAQLEGVEARHDAFDAVLIASAPQLLEAAESAVELAPAWKADRSNADAKAFDEALEGLQAAIKGGAADAEAPFAAPHTTEPDEQALLDAQELLAALSDYVAQANALQRAHADAVAAEEAAAVAAAEAEAASAQQPAYGGGWGDGSGWNGGGGYSGGGGGGNGSGGGGDGGFIDYGSGGGGGSSNPPPPGTCYRADSSGPEICY